MAGVLVVERQASKPGMAKKDNAVKGLKKDTVCWMSVRLAVIFPDRSDSLLSFSERYAFVFFLCVQYSMAAKTQWGRSGVITFTHCFCCSVSFLCRSRRLLSSLTHFVPSELYEWHEFCFGHVFDP